MRILVMLQNLAMKSKVLTKVPDFGIELAKLL